MAASFFNSIRWDGIFRRGLKRRLILIMIGVGALPLLLAMMIAYFQGNKSLRSVLGASFEALAFETSTKIDLLFNEEIEQLKHWANDPDLLSALKSLPSSFPASSLPESPKVIDRTASLILQNLLESDIRYSEATEHLFITGIEGNLIASIAAPPKPMQTSQASWSFFYQALPKKVYLGPVVRARDKSRFVFEIAVPVRSEKNAPLAVLHRMYYVKDFFASAIEPILFGDTGHVMLINSEGVVLECPILPTGHHLKDPVLIKSVTGPQADWVEVRGDGHGGESLSIIGYSPLDQTNKIIEESSGQKLFTFAWQSTEELFAPTQKLFLWISASGFGSVLLILIMGSFAADRVVNPIRQLQKTAGAIGRGEPTEKLDIRTGDEIESLANEINSMNLLLQKSFAGLEMEVEKKSRQVDFLKEYTEQVLKSVPEAIVIFDPSGRIEFANDAFEKFLDLGNRDYIGQGLDRVQPAFSKELEKLNSSLFDYQQNSVLESARTNYPDSKQYQPQDPLLPPKLDGHTHYQSTLKIEDCIFAYQFFDMDTGDGEEHRTGLILKDITDEKKLLDRLARTEKLSGLGTLAAGIAHEMNNPLYTIMGFTEALLDEKDPVKIQKYAEKILGRSRHMASVILNLSGYSRTNDKDVVQSVALNDMMDAAIEMALLDSYSDDVELLKEYSDLPMINAKPEEIQQVFLNIVRNAVQAMDGKGRITIATCAESDHIEIIIADNGPGIPPDYVSKIFDPFFTTKEQGEGTGLGLNIVYRIIEKYGGHIEVDSKPGMGTTFIITLPLEQKGAFVS